MLVFVKNLDGKLIMPCNPAKCRRLLKQGKAKVIKSSPFTIQLNWQCEGIVQDITVGIDKGSKVTGFSAVGNGKILLSGEIKHRTDIKDKMISRAANRRQRRSRKWYRPPRFNNRASSKRSGRLPPSIRANAEEIVRIVNKIPLPISQIIVEDVQIDIAKLNDPNLRGKDYQKSNRLDENLRLATLIRDKFQCQVCKKNGLKLEAHHIITCQDGGKDSIFNLITLCSDCHKKVHAGTIAIKGGVSGFKDQIAQRTMQGKSLLYSELGKKTKIDLVFGYETSQYRKILGLPKEHDVDALCVATLKDGEIIEWNRDNFYNVSFYPTQTRRHFYDLPRKSKGRVRYQVNSELDGFRKGDVVLVKNKYRKQIKSIYSSGYLAFKRIQGEPPAALPRNCRLLEKKKTIIWNKVQ